MGSLRRIAPIFTVRDVTASLDYYRRLGFATREYAGGGYGFVTRDDVEIHVGQVPDGDPRAIRGLAYLWVDDADDLAAAWRVAGADVREPQDTDWGQHEGVLIDPDGNIIRFGSPAGESAAGGTATGSPPRSPGHAGRGRRGPTDTAKPGDEP